MLGDPKLKQVSVPRGIVERVRDACAHLPEVNEEQPFGGVRWRIRGCTLAELKAWEIEEGTLTRVTFHASEEGQHLISMGHPFYPGWGPGLVAMVLTDDDTTDWEDLRELLTESYCLLAPKKLIVRLGVVQRDGGN